MSSDLSTERREQRNITIFNCITATASLIAAIMSYGAASKSAHIAELNDLYLSSDQQRLVYEDRVTLVRRTIQSIKLLNDVKGECVAHPVISRLEGQIERAQEVADEMIAESDDITPAALSATKRSLIMTHHFGLELTMINVAEACKTSIPQL